MIDWWFFPLIATLASALFVTWVARNDGSAPFSELIALSLAIILGFINLSGWVLAWLVKTVFYA